MKIIAAYLVAVLGGNERPTAEDLKRILGAEAEDDKIQLLLEQVEGKEFNQFIASCMEKLASFDPATGGGVSVTVAAPPAIGAPAETKKEEKEEDKPESDDDDAIFGLFD